jgi:hypothetical protein
MSEMKMKSEATQSAARRGERGAALVTALLLSTLLLVAGGALILTTAVGTSTAADAATEIRAYYAAEAGLQAALSVLRGNVAARAGHNPPAGTKMKNNFRAANTLTTSNITGDAAIASGTSRLSGYLPYNGTAATSRVQIDANTAYQISVTDPEDPNRAQLSASASYTPTRLVITSIGYGPRGALDADADRQHHQLQPRQQQRQGLHRRRSGRHGQHRPDVRLHRLGQSDDRQYHHFLQSLHHQLL